MHQLLVHKYEENPPFIAEIKKETEVKNISYELDTNLNDLNGKQSLDSTMSKQIVAGDNTESIHKVKKNIPFKCELCDYGSSIYISRQYDLNHVASVHERKKPFSCKICSYRCSYKSGMKNHVASVHEVKKPYKCKLCDYCSSQISHMNQHVANVHEGKKAFKIKQDFKIIKKIKKEKNKKCNKEKIENKFRCKKCSFAI